jgi:signal transduction histidine kinase
MSSSNDFASTASDTALLTAAGESARKQVLQELKEAGTRISTLLNDIFNVARAKGDDKTLLQRWKKGQEDFLAASGGDPLLLEESSVLRNLKRLHSDLVGRGETASRFDLDLTPCRR